MFVGQRKQILRHRGHGDPVAAKDEALRARGALAFRDLLPDRRVRYVHTPHGIGDPPNSQAKDPNWSMLMGMSAERSSSLTLGGTRHAHVTLQKRDFDGSSWPRVTCRRPGMSQISSRTIAKLFGDTLVLNRVARLWSGQRVGQVNLRQILAGPVGADPGTGRHQPAGCDRDPPRRSQPRHGGPELRAPPASERCAEQDDAASDPRSRALTAHRTPPVTRSPAQDAGAGRRYGRDDADHPASEQKAPAAFQRARPARRLSE